MRHHHILIILKEIFMRITLRFLHFLWPRITFWIHERHSSVGLFLFRSFSQVFVKSIFTTANFEHHHRITLNPERTWTLQMVVMRAWICMYTGTMPCTKCNNSSAVQKFRATTIKVCLSLTCVIIKVTVVSCSVITVGGKMWPFILFALRKIRNMFNVSLHPHHKKTFLINYIIKSLIQFIRIRSQAKKRQPMRNQ